MPMRFKKILCPTDFSEASRHAVRIAADLAARDDGELCLVHVVEVEPALPTDPCFVMEVPEYRADPPRRRAAPAG